MPFKISFALDRGGTFTDCIAHYSNSTEQKEGRVIEKLLSEDPKNYPDAAIEGIRRLLEKTTGNVYPKHEKIATTHIESIRLGTTIATNALLERKGEPCALLITKGFKNLLEIGNQSRPDIFDLKIQMPEVLYTHVVEVDERVIIADADLTETDDQKRVCGIDGQEFLVERSPDEAKILKELENIKDRGINSLAICLMHGYTFKDHEKMVENLAKKIGFQHIFTSSTVLRIVPRAHSTVANAYLTPKLKAWISQFLNGFEVEKDPKFLEKIFFMKSDGGLVSISDILGSDAILSGPAGGVVGYSKTSWDHGTPVIGFDMGGTSTDVSIFDGSYKHIFETNIAGVTLQNSQLEIHTVAAGGGSRLIFKNNVFQVGPESAGANPGPTCYRKGGPLTVTDANLILGRLVIEEFPNIFGPAENEPLDYETTLQNFIQLTAEIKKSTGNYSLTVEQVALGFLKVANESMCRPIRNLTEAKGKPASSFMLACFGGAGGQHACSIARLLGIKTVLLHKNAPVLSALGLALADVTVEVREPCNLLLGSATMPRVLDKAAELTINAKAQLMEKRFKEEQIEVEIYLNLRYEGSDNALMVNSSEGKYEEFFKKAHLTEFGFNLEREIRVDDVRIRAYGKSSQVKVAPPPILDQQKVEDRALPFRTAKVYFDDFGYMEETPLYRLADFCNNTKIKGPAILMDKYNTILVEPHCVAISTKEHVSIHLGEIEEKTLDNLSVNRDPILTAIFGHRFMGIAEQMGEALRKTSVSTNVKERLDFSCALFDPEGSLIANAPHIPVHLGSLSHAVRYQLDLLGDDLHEGDVILTNHPKAGGSHLPDMTVITPVYNEGKLVFFTASRAHHADIGGITPGSMPPHSKSINEEGVAIISFKIVERHQFQAERLREIFCVKPGLMGYPGARNFDDNISDLKAQIAANHKGNLLMLELIKEYGYSVVEANMKFIREHAELAVINLLKKSALKYSNTLSATDYMDDGSPICLTVSIADDTATFDFTGSGPQVLGNWNAPLSVTFSAIIYCLRSLIGDDIPLNQGCLNPIRVIVPRGCFLDPSEEAAVVGGNVLTSQRLVDVILRAFNACAASQGDMNNLTFGQDTQTDGSKGWGYYETISGGSGAGPNWHGKSGVHTHMTNTRITDPEILEKRYPVILRQFSLRPDSGGLGVFKGGDGVIREFEFKKDGVLVSLLTERRAFSPYGMAGGSDGARGLNLLIKSDQRVINLGGKNSLFVNRNDRIRICTPGGGGWGK